MRVATSVAGFSASATGIVAYRAQGGTREAATWFDRSGTPLGDAADAVLNGPELSPDERRVAVDRTVGGNRDVWLLDLVHGGTTRLTTHQAIDGFPVWSPDGGRIAFESTRKGTFDLWIKPSSGGGVEELLLETSDSEWPLDWSRDGRFLLYQRSNLKEVWDLWALPMTGTARTPVAIATTSFAERMGQFSPDGRWVVYESNESGQPEIVAQAFPQVKDRWPISTGGGIAPRWSADGREIYFIAPDARIMAVPVTTSGSTFQAARPVPLFSTRIVPQPFKFQYAVSRDGRFLLNEVRADEASTPPITLIINWKP